MQGISSKTFFIVSVVSATLSVMTSIASYAGEEPGNQPHSESRLEQPFTARAEVEEPAFCRSFFLLSHRESFSLQSQGKATAKAEEGISNVHRAIKRQDLALRITGVAWGGAAPQILGNPPLIRIGQTQAVPSGAVAVAARQDDRSAKQKAIGEQAQRLVDMAKELKVDVDKTNKNILSLEVVRKAEEIEALVHRMKEENKR